MSLEEILVDRYNYSEDEAAITAQDLGSMDSESTDMLHVALQGQDVSGFACGDYSVGFLMEKKGLNIIAAILSIDELKKDYKNFSKILEAGNK